MQFVLNICALNQRAKPYPLCLRGGCEIEHDGNPLRQKSTNVWREHVLQPGITVHEGGNVDDLAWKQGIQEISCTRRQRFLEAPNLLPEWTCLRPSSRRRRSTSLRYSCTVVAIHITPVWRSVTSGIKTLNKQALTWFKHLTSLWLYSKGLSFNQASISRGIEQHVC
jgi:hypothetical protein